MEDLPAEDLHRLYPIPRSWTVAQSCLSAALIGIAVVFAWRLEWRWAAMIPFILAFPPLTIRFVSWAMLTCVGRPSNWPDLPTRP